MQEPAGHAFISYVREDSDRVDELQQALKAAGVPVWRDTADLWPGQDWRETIRRAITDNALVFIACFSRQSVTRVTSYQNEEFVLAVEQFRKRQPDVPWLIPVRFDDCEVPDRDLGGGRRLSSIQRADLFGDGGREQMRRVVTVVQELLHQASPSRSTGGEAEIPASHAAPPTGPDTTVQPPPNTTETAVQRLKQALPDPTRRIELADLVNSEIQQLTSQAADTTQHPLINVPFADQLTAYEQESATAAGLLATGVFYDDQAHTSLWIKSLQRLISARRPITGYHNPVTEAMRHYPALLCLWAMGLSTILADRENLLARFLLEPTWTPIFGAPTPQPAVHCLNPNRIVAADDQAPSGQRWLYPQSHHLRVASRGTFSQLEPDDDAYQDACDRLECIASLITMDVDKPNGWPWVGEFLLRFPGRGNYVALLEGGAFGGDAERAERALHALNAWVSQNPRF